MIDPLLDDDSIDLRRFAGVLRRRAGVIVASTLLVAAMAGGLSFLQHEVYEARADVLISRRASDQFGTVVGDSSTDASRNIQTEVKILQSRAVRDRATKRLGHPASVHISSDEQSDVVTVVASSEGPRRAARDADAYARAYVDYRLQATVQTLLDAGKEVQSQINDIDGQLAALPASSPQRAVLDSQRDYLVEQGSRLELAAGLANAGGAAVLAKAEIPDVPVSPKPLRNALIGAVLGLLLGIGLAFLLEYLDDTIKDRAGLELALAGAVPVLAEIPEADPPKKYERETYLVVAEEPTSMAAESVGILRTALTFLGVDHPMRTVQVTSAVAGEGKTTVATNLATSLARAGKRVIILDLDLRRPRVHKYFGLSNTIGFTTLLVDEETLASTIRRVSDDTMLAVVPSGRVPPNPSELLASPRVRDVLGAIAASADFVIVDSPPVLPVADALTIAGLVDATILVARGKQSSRRAVHRAIETLSRIDAPVVGAVLNAVDVEASGYGYGRYASQPRRSEPRRASGNGSGARRAPEPVPADGASADIAPWSDARVDSSTEATERG